jgi:plasmid stabilization system protein ParE
MKKYPIQFRQDFWENMDKIYDFIIKNFGINVLRDFRDSVFKSMSNLADFPEIGAVARESEHAEHKNLRQLVVKNHRIIYMIEDSKIFVLTILSARQNAAEEK